MKNKIIIILLSLLLILSVTFFVKQYIGTNVSTEVAIAHDPKNATYNIDGQSVTLVNGTSIVPIASSSVLKVTTQYFGNEVTHDFDGDGRIDTAAIITQNTGGSGTFYYVVAALNTVNGYVGSQGLLLGDRIAPQTTEISQDPKTPDVIIVNYADRKSGQSFAEQPSVGKSIWLKFDPKTMQFGEVVQNFEGEADPKQMTLGMKRWKWVNTTYKNDKKITPIKDRFTLTLNAGKTFSATTDCNGVGGEYTVNGNKITFTNMVSTLMYCEGSQEQDFTQMLGQIQDYKFTSNGELLFDLKSGVATMTFK